MFDYLTSFLSPLIFTMVSAYLSPQSLIVCEYSDLIVLVLAVSALSRVLGHSLAQARDWRPRGGEEKVPVGFLLPESASLLSTHCPWDASALFRSRSVERRRGTWVSSLRGDLTQGIGLGLRIPVTMLEGQRNRWWCSRHRHGLGMQMPTGQSWVCPTAFALFLYPHLSNGEPDSNS